MQEHLFEHFNSEGHNGFLHDVSVTLIDKTDTKKALSNENTGDIPSKRWDIVVLMLKMISKSQFTCFYIPCIDLLLIIIVILVIVIVIL